MNIGGNLVSVASARFGLRLLSQLVQTRPGENVIVSPLGLFQALSLYAFLGDPDDQRDVRKALYLTGLSDDGLQESYRRLDAHLQISSQDTVLASATAFWAGADFARDTTLADLARSWGIDFFCGADVSGEAMHWWAQEKTHGLLAPASDPPAHNAANLMNAVYFRGKWHSQFLADDTKPRPFYGKGVPKVLPLMRQSAMSGVRLYNGDQFEAARIPYKGDDDHEFALHIVLPRRNAWNALTAHDNLTPLVRDFTLDDMDRSRSAEEPDYLVDLILPRFQFRQKHELRGVLPHLELGKLFANSVSSAHCRLPAVERVVQQAYVSVDEEGTVATALTEVLFGSSLYPVEPVTPRIEKFYANRPFLFFLTEENSGLVLFAGVVHDPVVA